MTKTTYTPELAEMICERIAEGESLRAICVREDYPSVSTFLLWVAKSDAGDPIYAGLSEQYARAMEQRTEYMAEHIIEIADDAANDFVTDDEGNERFQQEAVQRAKLRIETRKWLMGKMKPKKYGDKVLNEHTGANGGPIQTQDVTITPKEAKAISQALDDEC